MMRAVIAQQLGQMLHVEFVFWDNAPIRHAQAIVGNIAVNPA